MEEKAFMDYLNQKMEGTQEHLRQELRALRAGRASGTLVEGIFVEVYGSQLRIKELATITVTEPRQLLITPFDVSNAGPIAKAVEKANLGVRTAVEGKIVRVFVPELDGARRKDLVNQVHKKREECKVSVRNVRREANERLKEMKAAGLPEDDNKRLEKHVQEVTDRYCKEADGIASAKEKEVMTV